MTRHPVSRHQVSRRDFLKRTAASAAAVSLVGARDRAKNAGGRVVVVGGGFAGASCARTLKRIDPRITVDAGRSQPTFTACPFSNTVIAGLRDLKAQQFGYKKLAADKIVVTFVPAISVDADARTVILNDGARLPYDRLVLAPGIDIRWDALPGYNEAAAERMPHAWRAGEQTLLLRKQLESMEDGGLVVISAPANPFRCPPGPYERASLIAHYLKTRKPKSKLIILDAKDAFSKQGLFLGAWKELYPELIEWVPLSKGGRVTAVDPKTNTLTTEFGSHKAAVANVIPPQRAGAHRRACRRRRQDRLVPDRSGDVRVEAAGPTSTSSATPASPAACRNRRSPRIPRPRSAPPRSPSCSPARSPRSRG